MTLRCHFLHLNTFCLSFPAASSSDRIFLVDVEGSALGVLEHINILRDAVGEEVVFSHVELQAERVDVVRAEA